MKNLRYVFGALFICLSWTAAFGFGQAVNFASLQGRVTDSSGAVVPGASVQATQVATPIDWSPARRLTRVPLLVPILRAGLGLVPGFHALMPQAQVAHVGLYRDPDTLHAVPYYSNLPDDLHGRRAFVLDPMLATGGSAIAAVDLLLERGAVIEDLRFISLIAAPEGVDALHAAHPTLRSFTCALDKHLNDHGYIVPGLGDAGDRLYGRGAGRIPQTSAGPAR